jgi:hypothetical protein
VALRCAEGWVERQGMVFKSIQGFSSYMGQKIKSELRHRLSFRWHNLIFVAYYQLWVSIMPRCAAVCSVSYM